MATAGEHAVLVVVKILTYDKETGVIYKIFSNLLAYVIQMIYICSVIKNKEIMTDLNKASRADLEVAILENDLDETLFGGLDNIMAMDTEEMREKLISWVIKENEATCK